MDSRLIASMMNEFHYHTMANSIYSECDALRIEITKDYGDLCCYEMCITFEEGTYFQVLYDPSGETDGIDPILKNANYTVSILENNTNLFHTLKFGQTESGILWQNINKK
jgi:hypothetical protein